MKRVCFFGIYDPEYSRNRVLKRAFQENGFEIVECRVNPRKMKGLSKYVSLVKLYQALPDKHFEHVVVCFPGHSVVWLTRMLFGKDIIFDAFVSLYDSNVHDRKRYSKFSPSAWYSWLLDWSSLHLAGRVLVDTYQHGLYFTKTFSVNPHKMIRFLVASDDTLFYPREASLKGSRLKYLVHFHGSYIPLQGVERILEAAKLLEDENITFRLIGNNRTSLKNVEFVGRVPLEELPLKIAEADLCLGIFGSTDKAQRVIPNKVYEYAAMGKPIITMDTPAAREVFTPGTNVLLCRPTGEGIAEAILKLEGDRELAASLGMGARQLFETRLTPHILGAELLKNID